MTAETNRPANEWPLPPEPGCPGRKRWGLAVFGLLAAYFGALAFQGFDMTDEGHHLTNQLMCAQGRGEYAHGMLWLTHLLGGWWLKAAGALGLLGARLGWVLVLSLTGLVAYSILSAYFRPRLCALGAVGGALVCTHHGNMVINQNNLPFLLLLCAAGLLLAADRAPAAGGRLTCAALSGGLLGIAVMARFPLAVSPALVLLPPLVRWWQERQTRPDRWAAAGIALLACALAVLGCLGWLRAQGHLGTYLGQLSGADLNEGHTLKALAAVYAGDVGRTARLLALLLIKVVPWAVGLDVLCRWAGWRRGAPAALAACLGVWLANAVRAHGLMAVQWEYFVILPGLCLLAAAVGLLAGRLRPGAAPEIAARQVLLAVAAAAGLLIAAGTDNGLLNVTYGLWLLFPAGVLILPDAVRNLWRGGPANVSRARVAAYTAAVASVLVVFSVAVRMVNPYRDSRARWRLTAEIGGPRLRGIFTTPSRAASVRALARELESRVRPGAVVLAYNSIPMIHFLTRSVPALDMPWPILWNRAALARRLARMEAEGPQPVAVVRALTDMGDRRWGGGAPPQPAGAAGPEAERVRLLDEAVRRMGYQPVWSNADFVVLVR